MKHFGFLCGLAIIGLPNCAAAQDTAVEYREHPFFYFDSAEGFTADIALSDVDGDGDLDALTANGRHWAQQDFVFLNSGNGRFLEANPIGNLSASYVLCPGDFDGDGDIDLVVVRDILPAQLFLNDGAGQFSLAETITGTGGHARSAIVLDANDDGLLDIAVARRRGADIILYGDGDGKFAAPRDLPGDGKGSTGIAASDLDMDGDTDIVIARRDGQPSTRLMNAGNGQFQVTDLAGSTGNHRKAVIADFDQDGLKDIILVSTNGVHKLYTSGSDGKFSSFTSFGTEGRVSQAMAAADLDGDGDIDLVEGTETTNAIYVNDGTGAFEMQIMSVEAADTYGVAIGDMNGDDKPDIVFANSGDGNIVLIAK